MTQSSADTFFKTEQHFLSIISSCKFSSVVDIFIWKAEGLVKGTILSV